MKPRCDLDQTATGRAFLLHRRGEALQALSLNKTREELPLFGAALLRRGLPQAALSGMAGAEGEVKLSSGAFRQVKGSLDRCLQIAAGDTNAQIDRSDFRPVFNGVLRLVGVALCFHSSRFRSSAVSLLSVRIIRTIRNGLRLCI